MKGKKVPLLTYHKGNRVVVGEATMHADGTISAMITDEELAVKMRLDELSGFSIIKEDEDV